VGRSQAAAAAGEVPAPERDLLARLRAGEDAAFAELVRGHAGRLRAVAARLLRGDADADDVVQEAFLSAVRKLGDFEGRCRLGTWLHRIVVNHALMRLRSRRGAVETPVDDLLPGFAENGTFAEDPAEWRLGPHEMLCREESRRAVAECIDRLPETHRVAIVLRDVEGLDNAEVAEALGVTPGAAKVRVHRARQALKTLLEQRIEGLVH
jgi:RNA polymerase sigma-70 factor (ECF subfamily)